MIQSYLLTMAMKMMNLNVPHPTMKANLNHIPVTASIKITTSYPQDHPNSKPLHRETTTLTLSMR